MPTKIPWTDETWNVVTGCTPCSIGCTNCFAARMAATRLKHHPRYEGLATINDGKARWTGEVRLNHDVLEQPLRWRKPRRVFVASMGDLFHKDIPDEFIAAVLGVMAASGQIYQVLTKRAERMYDLLGGQYAKAMAIKVDTYKHVALAGRISEVFAAERTKPVKDWPGYFVTTRGRILSDRNHGGIRDASIVHEMRPQASTQGYSRVELQVNGSSFRPLIHRLVLESFDRPAKTGEQCCHIDGDATNNCLWNLRWGSQSNNWDDSKRHGTHRRYSKINAEQVDEIHRRLKAGESAYAVAPDYNISGTQVRNIGRGDQWKPEYIPEWPLSLVWLGVSVENQAAADERREYLEQCPAAVKFVSYEPALGPVDWTGWEFVSQIISGGESGPGARPSHPDWHRATRDFCWENDIAYFFKQWGAWRECLRSQETGWKYRLNDDHKTLLFMDDGRVIDYTTRTQIHGMGYLAMERVGKKAAGHLLDGREWQEFPVADGALT